MYMKATEARNQWKEVLDLAANGEVVEIERGGITFYLSNVPPTKFFATHVGVDPAKLGEDRSFQLRTKAGSDDIEILDATGIELQADKPTVGKIKSVANATPEKHIEFCKHGNVKGFCKKGCK